MHPKYLKSYFLKKIRNIIICFGVSLAIIGGITIFTNATKQKSEQALSELKTKESINSAIKAKLNIANTALIAWQDIIKKEHSERNGLKVKLTQKTVDQLKQVYRISKLNIGLTNPAKRSDISSKFVDIAYSNVSLNFNAYTDIDAVLFIDKLLQQMPGHVIIKSLDITGIDTIDKTVLLNLSGGLDTGIVTAKVELFWQDMQDKVKLNNSNNKSVQNH